MDIFFLVTGLLFLFVLLYLFFLAAASLWPEKARPDDNGQRSTFAILIPAHDESGILQRTLDNIKEVDYPEECYQIFVVADNCTDNTAEIVTGIQSQDQRLRYIKLPYNRGIGFARDIGLRYSRGAHPV